MNGETLRALLVMLVTQAAVVMAAYAAPVLGKQITGDLAIAPALIGYYTSIVFAAAMTASLFCGALIQRLGPVRVSQWTVLFAILGLALLAAGTASAVFFSALLIGFAYAPGNPASSQLLIRTTPPQSRNAVFSLKQTAVPLGIALAGILIPLLIHFFSWRSGLLIVATVFASIVIWAERWRKPLDSYVALGTQKFSPFAALRLVLASPALRRLGVVSLSLASIQFGFSAIFVTFLQQAASVSTAVAGSLLSAAMALSVVSRIVLGASADRFGGRRMLLAMAIMMVLSASALIAASGMSIAAVAAAGIVLGATAFSWNGVYLAEVADAAPTDAVALATSGTMFFIFLGGFLGPAFASAAILIWGIYEAAFAVLAGFAALGAAALLLPDSAFASLPKAEVKC